MKVVCVIPAFNEERRIGNVIKNVKKYVDKIIVVDDGSKDNTYIISKKARAEVIRYKENKGVGYATKIGLRRAIKLKPDIIVFLDSDGQHNPRYVPEFVNAIKNGADYVMGWRDLKNYPFNRKIGNWGLKTLANVFCPTDIKDTECGYRALKLKAAKKVNIKAKRYGREMDFVYESWKNKFKVKQIKIKVPVFHKKEWTLFVIIRGFKNFFHLLKRRFNLI